jgi:oxygen-independent coproporphyrinogen-3 oxidase
MAGIYVHIPFCRQACHYCNFYFSVSLASKNGFIGALLKEIVLQQTYLAGETVDTLYFGGGTPSLLERADLSEILAAIRTNFQVSPQAEITLEANPDDISAGELSGWKAVGINRLSIGIQSFIEKDLRWMNRAHNAEQARNCIALAQSAGFTNLSVDLIYGTPGLGDQEWQENVDAVIGMHIPHLSCYALTVETGTALDKMIAQHKREPADPEQQARQFLQLVDRLGDAGYEHYEISNFARPGMRSRHNASYWAGTRYLGLGPSAHSYNGRSRQWNVASNLRYGQELEKGILPFESETLTLVQHLNEYIMTSLRTAEGLDTSRVEKLYGAGATDQLEAGSAKYINKGHLTRNGSFLQLSREGKLFADGIAADLFFLPGTVPDDLPAAAGT